MSDAETPAPRRRRTVVVALVIAAVALIAAVVLAVVLLRPPAVTAPPASPSPAPTVSTTPTKSPTPTPTPTATATASPAGPVATIPGDCEGLYSPEMWALLSSQFPELNPLDYVNIADKLTSPELGAMLDAIPGGLSCSWRMNMHVGVGTRVVPVDATTAAAVEAELAATGYTPIEEPWGTRWFIQFDGEELPWGESHALVGGVWFATAWVGTAPDGYTADMVATIVR